MGDVFHYLFDVRVSVGKKRPARHAPMYEFMSWKEDDLSLCLLSTWLRTSSLGKSKILSALLEENIQFYPNGKFHNTSLN